MMSSRHPSGPAGIDREMFEARRSELGRQLHEHLLFNALNSISAELHSDPRAADRMICRLSEFLRSSLRLSVLPSIALEDELEHVACYLGVERIRFGSRVELVVDCPEALAGLAVPPAILQPLVENAIHHGVARSIEPVTITVQARREGDRLAIHVLDDARPMSAQGRTPGSGGVGLANVRARLYESFGDDAKLTTQRLLPCGYESAIELPARRQVERPKDRTKRKTAGVAPWQTRAA